MKFLLVLIFLNTILFSSDTNCKLDIYFGNGIQNTEEDSRESLRSLKSFIFSHNLENFPNKKDIDAYEFKIAYNGTAGTDFLSTDLGDLGVG